MRMTIAVVSSRICDHITPQEWPWQEEDTRGEDVSETEDKSAPTVPTPKPDSL